MPRLPSVLSRQLCQFARCTDVTSGPEPDLWLECGGHMSDRIQCTCGSGKPSFQSGQHAANAPVGCLLRMWGGANRSTRKKSNSK